MMRIPIILFLLSSMFAVGLFFWNRTRPEKVVLEVEGYGYEVGDIVQIESNRIPKIDEVVLYDAYLNKSYCGAMGPGVGLAKITGLAGDKIQLNKTSFSVNRQTFPLEDDYSRLPLIILGDKKYKEIPAYELDIPQNEFTSDKWVGQECTGETNENGVTIFYNRFTIKSEAIKGVLIKKIDHDSKFERGVKSRVY